MDNNVQLDFTLIITIMEIIDSNYSVRTISSFEVSHINIGYRAEGNANIVLSLPLQRQVLRLPKSTRYFFR